MGAAVMGMGIAMPSCPGQQALQQQVEALQTSNAELNTKVQALESGVKNLNGSLIEITKILQQTGINIDTQSKLIQNLTSDMAALRSAKPAKSAAKAHPLKKRSR
ncbi:MAG TPA: hypothetical protein DCS07_16775 [Bdellovibrionales bacterium]|nr:MAG: hypothetical protein A2Z97_04540 [Bdellovibrionales bacterium GWB1_52_6]OFZ06319.1 MAG: hypothetical protein A2X97_02540 [Bdellovibrionales bacterium GWA1_52_35]OFZ33506.1 MAG: hypothetical protein A2070_06005 [Bdellovibrionales bacterium GWC1_52_8]HAR44259.1 hypothetical protein [Bdellovibrionales bacterium]HCM40069.1 hypothetical protein [Bdellovibrionales bacterium]